MDRTDGTRSLTGPLALWGLTRLLLLLFAFKVYVFPGPDVTSDVSVIYQGWYEVLRTGTFPLDDVTWQYPPAAALAIVSPALLSFLDYAHAFFVLVLLADLAVLALLCGAGGGPAGRCAAPGCGWRACRCSGRRSTPATTCWSRPSRWPRCSRVPAVRG
ncbi:hypothetical protein GCM10020295_61530 [Streptomyces cinereospinus]